MRYYSVIFFLLFVQYSFAQEDVSRSLSPQNYLYLSAHQPDLTFLDDLRDSKIVSVRTNNKFFNKSYLINKNGEALSSSYMSSSNFLANDNLIVVRLSTFNTFLSRIKIKRR